MKYVMDKLDTTGSDHYVVKESPVFDKLSDLHEKILAASQQSQHNILLKDI